jgi:hypothetical protein
MNKALDALTSLWTGLFAVLCDVLRVKGSGASKISGAKGALVSCLCVTVVVLMVGSAPALAARGHEFKGLSIGEPGSGPGQLKEPAGVAVNEASGDVYVLDQGNDRVQWFSLNAAKDKYEYAGQITGASGEGMGAVTDKSKIIEGVSTSHGAFTPGEEISGEGIPAKTTITAVDALAGTLELSAEATETPVGPATLSAHQSFSLSSYSEEEEPLQVSGIAVDNTCRLEELKTKLALSEAECTALDPSNGDVYVVDVGVGTDGHEELGAVDKFKSDGEYVGQLTEGMTGAPFSDGEFGVGVDSKGTVWVYHKEFGPEIAPFSDGEPNTAGTPVSLQTIEFSSPGFAVESEDNFYVHFSNFGGDAIIWKFNREGQKLSGNEDNPIDLEQASGVATELSSDDLYIDNSGSVARFAPDQAQLERLTVPGGGGVGVGVDAASETLFVATSGNVVQVGVPEPPKAPAVAGLTVSDVTGEGAMMQGEVSPEGAATSYRFEYGACTGSGSCAGSAFTNSLPVGGGSVGSEGDFTLYPVSVRAQALSPNTFYHYRLVASNEINGHLETVVGQEQTFRTQNAAGAFAMLDGRQWEMVSPPAKHGAQLQMLTELVQGAAGGGAFTFTADVPTESQPEGRAKFTQVFAVRGSAGWTSQDISPSNPVPVGTEEASYPAFSEDLSRSVLQPYGPFISASSPFALAPNEASEQTPFLRSMFAGGEPSDVCQQSATNSCFRPLVSGLAGFANVPEGTVFGACKPGSNCGHAGPSFEGASGELTHMVIRSKVALTGTPLESHEGLYEWSEGKLALVSLLPHEPGQPEVTAGEAYLGGGGNGYVPMTRNAISADGTRVFWTEGSSVGPHGLFVRDVPRGETLRLDVAQPGCTSEACEARWAEPTFQTASPDGSRVFFTDQQRLTSDGGAKGKYVEGTKETEDLYECEVLPDAQGGLECRLSDLTPLSAGGPADVQSLLLGSSEEGCDVGSAGECNVFFVANGQLTSEANARGEHPVKGNCAYSGGEAASCNLYEAHLEGAQWKTSLVTVLSQNDAVDWGLYGKSGDRQDVTARVSPNGRFLVFMSERDLTGYSPVDAVTGRADEEVYEFDAQTGGLACVSCDPTGAHPVSVNPEDVTKLDKDAGWQRNGLAGFVPAWLAPGLHQPRYLLDDGRAFFDSPDGLVSADVNGVGDVYEYEPAGVGSCGPVVNGASIAFKAARVAEWEGLKGEEPAGCVGLISSGTASEEAGFLDSSESGEDVFFQTTAKLVPQDYDSLYDDYDAHECSTGSPCPASPAPATPACQSADACRAAPTPQPEVFGTPASETFSAPAIPPSSPVGEGKAKKTTKPRCKPPKRSHGGRCVPVKHSKTKHSKAKRAATRRRGRRK